MTSRISGGRYVLAVQNLERSAAFYTDKLGFQTLWTTGGWQFLYRDQVSIMIGECPDEVPASETGCHSWFAYLEVENIDALYIELKGRRLETIGDITDKPWGQREFTVHTIDGHRIAFGEPLTIEKEG
ncbi:MAG TPA: VOC family protein [Flavisolibacter sp.]